MSDTPITVNVFKSQREHLIHALNEYLNSLPTDSDRLAFFGELDACTNCGATPSDGLCCAYDGFTTDDV